MPDKCVRSQAEIDDLVGQLNDAQETGSMYPGMSYEDGVRAAVEWLTDEEAEHPLEE